MSKNRKKPKRTDKVVLKIVVGGAGSILFALSLRDILLEYVLPPEFQAPFIMLAIGFVLVFIAGKI